MKTFITLSNEKKKLPTEFQGDDNRFPETLVKYFLENYTKKGDKVLDPFVGLGTTMVVSEKLGRIPFGIEYNKRRYEYIISLIKNKKNIINGDSLKINSYELPQFDFCMTSPPFMSKEEATNPFNNYRSPRAYEEYIKDMGKIFAQVKNLMKPNSYTVIEVANLKGKEVTTLAWDVAKEVSKHLKFVGEVIIGWTGKDSFGFGGGTCGFGYDHSYCLVFTKGEK